MRKMLLTPLILCVVAVLFTLSVSAVHATEPDRSIGGTWTYKPTIIGERLADGNLFRYGEEDSMWGGTFVGESHDIFTVVIHPSGFVNVKGLINFVESDSDGENTLLISFVGKRTLPGPWYGQWVILGGTGDLASLHGQGNWWGPPTNCAYSGQIHFD